MPLPSSTTCMIMEDEPLKTAILGTGAWANLCLRALRATPGIKLIGCHGPDPASLAQFARTSGLRAVDSEDELLDTPGLEAVLLLTPNHVHCRQTLAATRRGLHVFVEKPMAPSTEECRLMIAAALENNVVLFVGHNTRREARFRRMANMISGGDLGKPAFAEITFTSPAGLAPRHGGWRYDKSLVPSPGLVQIGIHAIDVLHSLFGPAMEACAWLRSEDLHDVCLAQFRFPNGLGAHFTSSYTVPRIRKLQVTGTLASLGSKTEDTLVLRHEGEDAARVLEVDRNDTVREEFEEFAECCRGLRTPLTGGREGLQAVAVMEAILRSASSGGQTCAVHTDR